MDVQMPELDGLEATRRYREQEPEGQHLPIVAMTAHAMKGDRERCLAAGMDDYLSKPLEPEEVFAVIEQWTGRSNTHTTGSTRGRAHRQPDGPASTRSTCKRLSPVLAGI